MISTEERNNLGSVYNRSFNAIGAIRTECKTFETRMNGFEAILDGITNMERLAVLYAFMAFVASIPPIEPEPEPDEEIDAQETNTNSGSMG